MAILLLVRHGENEYIKQNKLPGQQSGIHLNQYGSKQAAMLAESLKPAPIKAIYSSTLERALETAAPLAEALKLEVQPRPTLMDIDVGSWTGRTFKMLNRLKGWKVVQRAPSLAQFPGGETFLQAQARIVGELNTIARAHPKGVVAIFFHADPIKLAIAHYIGLPMDYLQRLVISTGSVSILAVGEMGAALLALNLIPPFSLPYASPPRPKRKPAP
jgi:probable phosphoglycerate mutase